MREAPATTSRSLLREAPRLVDAAPGFSFQRDWVEKGKQSPPPPPGATFDFDEWLSGKPTRPVSAKGWLADTSRPPQQQPRPPVNLAAGTASGDYSAHGAATINNVAAEIAATPEGARNDALNVKGLRAYRIGLRDGIDRDTITNIMATAARNCGLHDTEIAATLRSAATGADLHGPADPPLLTEGYTMGATTFDAGHTAGDNGGTSRRRITLTPATQIRDDVPTWAWEHRDAGRILKRALTMFGGRPGAGKSCAARWFAAGYSTGTIPGCWEGQPQNVAYLAAEESIEHMVKPSLRAHGANLDRILFVSVEQPDGTAANLSALGDEKALSDALRAANVTVVIVDPIMSTIGAQVDAHRTNETRSYLEPWVRTAEHLDGIVIGIAHLKKAAGGDVVGALMGSSAFGEVPRCVFGFAKDPGSDEGHRIVSQAKNSAGREDLTLNYRLESETVLTDSGRAAPVARFVIIGDADRRVEDVLGDTAGTGKASKGDLAAEWLRGFTSRGGDESSAIKAHAEVDGHTRRTIERAASKLGYTGQRGGFGGGTQWERPA